MNTIPKPQPRQHGMTDIESLARIAGQEPRAPTGVDPPGGPAP